MASAPIGNFLENQLRREFEQAGELCVASFDDDLPTRAQRAMNFLYIGLGTLAFDAVVALGIFAAVHQQASAQPVEPVSVAAPMYPVAQASSAPSVTRAPR